MSNRRDFCKQLGALGALAVAPDILGAKERKVVFPEQSEKKMIWAYLIHLSYNMWEDFTAEGYEKNTYPKDASLAEIRKWAHMYRPDLTCEKDVWDAVIDRLVENGGNMLVIDLGDAVKYKSHPEIAVNGAWTRKELRKELERIRALGLEVIPKLNFSTGHKSWLGEYQHQISSKVYYEVCKDLIDEVVDLFDHPRLFHIGMDEETCEHQSHLRYSVVRHEDLWWNDFYYFVNQVERNNVRPWIWSDMIWRNKDEFIKKMPKTVLQSNWVYSSDVCFDKDDKPYSAYSQAFINLEENGFDQVPTGSNFIGGGSWEGNENFGNLVRYGKRIIAPERLKGFMQTVWTPTLKPFLNAHYGAVDLIGKARKKYY